MIRHPAAFVASLIAKGWTFDFREFLDQPRLMLHLERFRPDIERLARDPGDIVDQGILLWNCIYGRTDDYRRAHPEWIFVRHEDLSRDPVAGFRAIFARLGLDFGETQLRYVEELSGLQTSSDKSAPHLRRNSLSNIDSWKRKLDQRQIGRILDGTEALRSLYYSEERGLKSGGLTNRISK